jgi:hypothetical protein
VKTVIGKKRYGGVTIMGAVGNCLSKSVFKLVPSTTKEVFMSFIEELSEFVKDGIQKPFLVLDNHAAHRSKDVRPTLNQYFQPLFMPPYSCEFNSIEHCWGFMKEKFRRRLAQSVHTINGQ